ncbi:hypothetical protein, partial [Gordonia amicalis]|uniref:hypothetical protein n=1 Tax=Gordonia amicalis TaxID=89053 RepID=UPI003A801286
MATAADNPDGAISRYWLNCVSDNANHLHDYGRLQWAARHRIASRARGVLKLDFEAAELTAASFSDLVERARETGSRTSLTSFGNAGYDLVKAEYFGGAFEHDVQQRAEALRMLDAIEDSWSGFAINGVQSLRLMRGQIALLESDPPLEQLTTTFLSVSRQATNENTGRRALVAAVRSGVVGSAAVWTRLEELLGGLDPVRAPGEFAVLSGL